MNKRILLLSGVTAGLLLSSCRSSQLYEANQYLHSDFRDNYYMETALGIGDYGDPLALIDLDSSQYSNGAGSHASSFLGKAKSVPSTAQDVDSKSTSFFRDGTVPTREGAKTRYPDWFTYTREDGSRVEMNAEPGAWNMADDGYNAPPNSLTDANGSLVTSFIGYSFGRTQCLITANSAFNNGVLSKLYNGQLFCEENHNLALVQVAQTGYNCLFPATLIKGDSFMMSFRGGSTFSFDYADSPTSKAATYTAPRSTSFDLHLRFFVLNDKTSAYDFYSVTAKEVWVNTDAGGNNDTFFGFRFSDVGITNTAGICGLSVSLENIDDGAFTPYGLFGPGTNKDYSWGLMVYEVMFPNSTW